MHLIGAALDAGKTREYMLQALKFSRYQMPKVLPVIDVVPDDVWAHEVCNDNVVCVATSLGYYGSDDPADKDVVHVRAGTPRPVGGIAVHELIHWLQAHSGWDYHSSNCQDIAAHEIEAYAVEYLRDEWAGIQRPLYVPDVYGDCVMRKALK